MIKRKKKPCKTCLRDSYIFSNGECKTCSNKTKSSPTGELALFVEIWNERPHVSELTGKTLLPFHHSQWHWQFLHVLNKQRFPNLRLDKRNILLALPQEHERQDSFFAFTKRKEELLLEVYKK